MSRAIEEHDYIGLSDVSLIKATSDKPTSAPKLKPKPKPTKSSHLSSKCLTTELRLGLPGDGGDVHGAKFSLGLVKNLVSGTKRCFSDAINGGSGTWVLPISGGSEMGSLKNVVSLSSSALGDDQKLLNSPASEHFTPSQAAARAQVVGWPPIRSFRKNSMAGNVPKDSEEKDLNLESGCLFIKVSMDGAPYLRKVDLRTYGSYLELSSALEKMFSGLAIGQPVKQGPAGEESIKGRVADVHHRSEYVLTYEDKDGDWMLVGDVPWNMFMDLCRRLRIIKSSEAVGLGSKVTEK